MEERLCNALAFRKTSLFLEHGLATRFICTAIADATGQLWRVKADNSALEEVAKVDFPNSVAECAIQSQEVLGAGNRLFVYERFGAKLDRRKGCAGEVPGGLFSLDVKTGRIKEHLAGQNFISHH